MNRVCLSGRIVGRAQVSQSGNRAAFVLEFAQDSIGVGSISVGCEGEKLVTLAKSLRDCDSISIRGELVKTKKFWIEATDLTVTSRLAGRVGQSPDILGTVPLMESSKG